MTRQMVVLSMHGHSVDSIVDILKTSNFSGFPVVTSLSEMLVVGYISRVEVCKGIEESLANATSRVTGNTLCYFALVDMRFPKSSAFVDLSSRVESASILLGVIFLSSTVDAVESTPFERICRIFTSLGIRYCLVTRHGKLAGILTRKTMHHFVHHVKDMQIKKIDDELMLPQLARKNSIDTLRRISFESPVQHPERIRILKAKANASQPFAEPLLTDSRLRGFS